jgi:AcrR family transcriptional regulator
VAIPSADDGRALRSRRTRAAILDALEQLVEAGDPQPNVGDVARRAGVSPRTVHAHFASVDELHRALADRAAQRVLSMLSPVDPAWPFARRLDDLVAQRARVNEAIGPLRRAAARQLAHSPALRAQRRRMRDASRDQVERVFATELAPLGPDDRARRVALVDSLLSGECWDLLRAEHGLSRTDAARSVTEGVAALLGVPGAPTGRGLVDEDATVARRLADLEVRIDRVVGAIEAGGPADVLVARLRALRAQRAELEQELRTARR